MKDKLDADYTYKAAFETIITGAAWPNLRVHAAYPSVSSLRSRCNLEEDTPLHCFYTCPCNCSFEHEVVKNTQSLIKLAQAQSDTFPCLWFRGILPSKCTEIESEFDPADFLDISYHNESNCNWASNTYYGDASGGKYTEHTKLRRVGSSIVQVNNDLSLNFGASFNLPGPVQSAGRGELLALSVLVMHLLPYAEVFFFTDNLNVFGTYNKVPKAGVNSCNCDLWKGIFSSIVKKALLLKVRWMPSHLKEKDGPLPDDVTAFDIEANDVADHYAGQAASRFQIPDEAAANFVYYAKLVKKIQKRLSYILMNLPSRK